MADIAVAEAGKVHIVQSIQQLSLPAAETIEAGDAVRIDTTAGTFTQANGSTAGEARIYGIADRNAIAGETITAIRRGIMDGFTFSQAYDAAIYLSNTDGRLGDAAGTVSTVVGRVIPGTAVPLGTAYDKLLSIEL